MMAKHDTTMPPILHVVYTKRTGAGFTKWTSSRQTERITYHVEQRWIEAIRRQADLDGFTYTQIVNEAFRQYFEGL
jgi:hypothetical protein